MKRDTNRHGKAFTLVELVSAITITGILSTIALPNFLGMGSDARRSAVHTMAGSVATATSINFAARKPAACNRNNMSCVVRSIDDTAISATASVMCVSPFGGCAGRRAWPCPRAAAPGAPGQGEGRSWLAVAQVMGTAVAWQPHAGVCCKRLATRSAAGSEPP